LPQRFAAGPFEFHRGQHCFQGAALRLESNGIDACIDPATIRGLDDGFGRIVLKVEIDGLDP